MALPRLNLKEIQVECNRPFFRGTDSEVITLMLSIVRGPRGRRKILGEAFTRQVYLPWIHFKVSHDDSVEELFRLFMQQLIHRGYRPLEFRELDRDDRWSDWTECDLSGLDLSSLERAEESSMAVMEEHEETNPFRRRTAGTAPRRRSADDAGDGKTSVSTGSRDQD